ncbi:MAG: hypothetical protein ACOYO1_12570 [Bacteroidales bacterium]
MGKFLLKTFVFLILISISAYFVFLEADGYTDPFYLRFTTPKQTSLILGTSRAAQGIQPQILNKILNRSDLFNYSFSIDKSPYGPTYLNSIIKKLDANTKNAIFILTVDPWSISSKCEDPNDISNFSELKLSLATTKYVNVKPNIEFLINNYSEPYYKILLKSDAAMMLHKDGWLEVNIDMDSALVQQRIEQKMTTYKRDNCPFYKFSSIRLQYLLKTIDFLQHHGQVYLVRLPIHPLMMELDENLMPDFNEQINRISKQKNTPYLDMTYLNAKQKFTDGNHLYKESGFQITKIIGEWILKLQHNIGTNKTKLSIN